MKLPDINLILLYCYCSEAIYYYYASTCFIYDDVINAKILTKIFQYQKSEFEIENFEWFSSIKANLYFNLIFRLRCGEGRRG